MDGLLLIDKPSGWTSFDVVAKVRGTLKHAGLPKPKVGHTGTLDPLATGLLILVVGSYCKRAQEFSKLDKTYQVTAKLGQTSTTGDAEGQLTAVSQQQPSHEQVEAAIAKFSGPISQMPPQYSAIKVNGKRAYQLAREGKVADLQPREVTIYGYVDAEFVYPNLSFEVSVSSGTYIRSLVEDIGTDLQTGAYTTKLRRTKVGDYAVDDAMTIEQLSSDQIAKHLITLA
ncbi:MAG: tRNA pseudouridine(55) synthase TruB [Candidatus Saccharimonadales bacterium]